jgi:hypothetical protein
VARAPRTRVGQWTVLSPVIFPTVVCFAPSGCNNPGRKSSEGEVRSIAKKPRRLASRAAAQRPAGGLRCSIGNWWSDAFPQVPFESRDSAFTSKRACRLHEGPYARSQVETQFGLPLSS